MRLFIEPSDVWLFRDGKPFTAGSDHRAGSRFPPSPTTIQGALRSKVLLESGVSLVAFANREAAAQTIADDIGWPGEQKLPFRLQGPFLARRLFPGGPVERLYSAPADLALTKHELRKEQRFLYLTPAPALSIRSDLEALKLEDELRLLWAEGEERLTMVEGWLTQKEFGWYLTDPERLRARLNRRQSKRCRGLISEKSLFVRESRVGIALQEQARRPTEGMLFEVEYIRPRQCVGLLVEIGPAEGDIAPAIAAAFGQVGSHGTMSLGGEGRLARWEVISEDITPAPLIVERYFKVVLLTPALFKQGWRTDWNKLFGGSVRLHAAAVGAPETISGWDVARNREKAARPTVPAGSVYFFEKLDASPLQLREAFTNDDAHLGFGQFAIGAWHV
ncbi:MAG: type III-B CRISPR module-associated protein Cmr3 [Ardenticatenales bacterium]|nr:type III-B CRISPR module-associated protein Cmr3 [Ardenticatenales bacterium]